MLKPKTLANLNAKARRVADVPRAVAEARAALAARIDDYWRFWCNPDDYSHVERRPDPATGKMRDVHVVARWRDDHPLLTTADGRTVLSIRWGDDLLPLTTRGEQEIVLEAATREVVEALLAEIKHAVKSGALDAHLVPPDVALPAPRD
jgi:hypothetical protein